jgi:hypothetical protein
MVSADRRTLDPGPDPYALLPPALGVVPSEVADAGDGWAADGGVVAVMVVAVEPVVSGGCAFVVAQVGADVGHSSSRVRWKRSMLLCSSSRLRAGVGLRRCSAGGREVVVDLAGDVALEASDDLSLAEAFGCAAVDVVAGGLMAAHLDDGDDVEGAVRGAVAAAAEAVSSGGSTTACGLWRDSAELGEGSLAVDPFRVVAGGDEELAGDVDPNAVELEEVGGGLLDQSRRSAG